MLSNMAQCTIVLLFDVLVAGLMIKRCSDASACCPAARETVQVIEVRGTARAWMQQAWYTWFAAMAGICVVADGPALVMVFSK